MNSDFKYYETVDENFQKAIELYENEFSHQELINLLNTDKVVDKQVGALRLETITSEEDAQVLINNLTGQDGKVREAVSFKLKEFMSNPELLKYFQNSENYEIFFNATLDINGNICRNTISAIKNMTCNKEFCQKFVNILIKTTHEILDKIEQFDIRVGKYTVNKELFKLYWCLEDIYEFVDFISNDDVKSILTRAKVVNEYTIREKTAKILAKNFNDIELLSMRDELRQDENYYVRRVLEDI